MRIIPAIDIMGGRVVRLLRGDPSKMTTYHDDPVAVAARWEKEGAHMLHVVDLDATLSLGSNAAAIRRIAGSVSVPVQAAGGLRTESMVDSMMRHADRVVVGTLALDRAALKRMAERYGERLVVSVDHDDGRVVSHGWQQDAGLRLVPAMESFVEAGASQFLVTNVSRDGTLEGPDLANLSRVCRISNVIASGGISGLDDVRAVARLEPYGVILGKALYEGLITIRGALLC